MITIDNITMFPRPYLSEHLSFISKYLVTEVASDYLAYHTLRDARIKWDKKAKNSFRFKPLDTGKKSVVNPGRCIHPAENKPMCLLIRNYCS